MKKQEFITSLRAKLSGLPRREVEERLSFYSEMIDYRIEEGLSEEEAVLRMGSIEAIASQIAADIPLLKIAKEKINPKRRLHAWEIVLLILGSPIWLSLLIAVFAVGLSVYAVLWSMVISLWAIFVSLVACFFAGIVAGISFAVIGYGLTGIATVGAGLVCGGISIFMFFGCRAATKGTVLLTKKIASGIRSCFVKRGEKYE